MIQLILFVFFYGLWENFWLAISIVVGLSWWRNTKRFAAYEKVIKLLWLRSEIKQKFEINQAMSQDRYEQLTEKLEHILTQYSEELKSGYSAIELRKYLEESWLLLQPIQHIDDLPEKTSSFKWVAPSSSSESSPVDTLVKETCEQPDPTHTQSNKIPVWKRWRIDQFMASSPSRSSSSHQEHESESSEKIKTVSSFLDKSHSLLKRWFHFSSRELISDILFPLLWQNLGWFISGLCFVSGTIFLVSYTHGFAKALAVFSVLLVYTSLSFFGGYQLRRHRPELVASSHALFILGVFLVPLNFSAGLRLIENSESHFLLLGLSIFLSLAMVGGLTVATQLASGSLDRHLLGRHPVFFISLASFQFFLFLLQAFPYWPVLGLLHLALLGVLSYALFLFGQHWLQLLFVERKFLTYYAVGTLIYATLVSFGHLTWGSSLTLPVGYTGSLLMVLTLLLFYVDVQVKHWIHKQTWLDYFIFVVYGLSITALLISATGSSLFLITFTFVLGIFLYAMMIWQYLTWPPIYLGLICLAYVYHLHILSHFPIADYFLLSAPGLAGLYALQQFAYRRQIASLALISCRVFAILTLGLLVVSLFWGSPSWVSMTTALVATGLIYFGFPFCLTGINLELYQGYLFTGLATLTLAYTPILPGFERWEQFHYGLVVLILLWSLTGVWSRIVLYFRLALLNSALLSLMLYLALTVLLAPRLVDIPLFSLIIAALILLWLSLNLYSRALFYGVIILMGIFGELLKYHHVPKLYLGTFVVSLLLFGFLQWLQRLPKPVTLIDSVHPAFTLLGWLPIRSKPYTSWSEMVYTPLEQAFYLLWFIMLVKVGIKWFHPPLTPLLAFTTALITLTTLLVTMQSRQSGFLALVIMMGMASLFALVNLDWWLMLAASYTLIIWLMYKALWFFPRLRGKDDLTKIEPVIYWTTFSINLITTAITLVSLMGMVNLFDVITLSLVTVFFGLTGYAYQSKLHSYLTLGGFHFVSIFLYEMGSGHSWSTLLHTHHLTPLVAALMSGMAFIQYFTLSPTWQLLYREPAFKMIGIFYLGVLLDSLFLLFSHVPMWLPGMFLLLAFFALMFNGDRAQLVRGSSVPILLLAALASVLVLGGMFLEHALILSSFVMWALGTYLLPHWNRRWPNWAMELEVWKACGALGFGGTFIEGVQHYETSPLLTTFLWIFLALFQFPLLHPLPQAPKIRGVGVVVFLTFAFATVLQGSYFLATALMGWSLLLWATAHFLLPQLNQYSPFWHIEAEFWLIWGLFLITGGLLFPLGSLHFPPWWNFAMATLYYFLMLPRMVKLAWGVVLGFLGFGISLTLDLPSHIQTVFLMLWLNVLIQAILVCHRYANVFPQWPLQALAKVFFKVSGYSLWAILFTDLIAMSSCFPYCFEPVSFHPQTWAHTTQYTVLLALSFLHFIWFSSHPLIGHGFILSWSTLILLLGVKLGITLPLLWSMESLILLMIFEAHPLKKLAEFWVMVGAILTLISISEMQNTLQASLALGVLSAISLIKGLRTEASKQWLVIGIVLFIGFIHWIWLEILPEHPWHRSLPWYAAQSLIFLILAWTGQKKTLHQRVDWLTDIAFFPFLGLTVLTWLSHYYFFVLSFVRSDIPAYLFADHLVALGTGLSFIVLTLNLIQEEGRIYILSLITMLLLFYIRLLWIGWVPVTLWDTAAIMSIGYGLVGLQRIWESKALYHLVLVIPILALLTIPIQLSSMPATVVLLSSGTLYFLMQRREQFLPLYLGLICLNLGAYLWIPDLSTRNFWPYTAPASVTVLFMLHCHWLELRPSMIHLVRMITLSIFYASVLADGFLRPEIQFFSLAILLALLGIFLGIVLQIRAFLYTGSFFMTLNILGQLIHFYPEGRLEKAIILITLGMFIMINMIVFNIQREAILTRFRIMRSGLASWE